MLAPFSFSYAPVVPMTTDTAIQGIGHSPYIILIYLIFYGWTTPSSSSLKALKSENYEFF